LFGLNGESEEIEVRKVVGMLDILQNEKSIPRARTPSTSGAVILRKEEVRKIVDDTLAKISKTLLPEKAKLRFRRASSLEDVDNMMKQIRDLAEFERALECVRTTKEELVMDGGIGNENEPKYYWV